MIEASRTNECISGDHFNDGGIEKVDTSRLCTHYDDRVDNTICAIYYSAAGDVVSFSFYDKSTMISKDLVGAVAKLPLSVIIKLLLIYAKCGTVNNLQSTSCIYEMNCRS